MKKTKTDEDESDSDKGISEDDNDEKEVVPKKPLKPLTDEEKIEKCKAALEKALVNIKKLSQTPARNTEEEGQAPYNPDFKKTLLSITRLYFSLGIKRYSKENVYKFRKDVAHAMFENGVIKLICDLTSESFQKRLFLAEDGNTVKSEWNVLMKFLNNMLNYTNVSEEWKHYVGSHPTLLKAMRDFIVEKQPPHIEKLLKVRWLMNENVKVDERGS